MDRHENGSAEREGPPSNEELEKAFADFAQATGRTAIVAPGEVIIAESSSDK